MGREKLNGFAKPSNLFKMVNTNARASLILVVIGLIHLATFVYTEQILSLFISCFFMFMAINLRYQPVEPASEAPELV